MCWPERWAEERTSGRHERQGLLDGEPDNGTKMSKCQSPGTRYINILVPSPAPDFARSLWPARRLALWRSGPVSLTRSQTCTPCSHANIIPPELFHPYIARTTLAPLDIPTVALFNTTTPRQTHRAPCPPQSALRRRSGPVVAGLAVNHPLHHPLPSLQSPSTSTAPLHPSNALREARSFAAPLSVTLSSSVTARRRPRFSRNLDGPLTP